MICQFECRDHKNVWSRPIESKTKLKLSKNIFPPNDKIENTIHLCLKLFTALSFKVFQIYLTLRGFKVDVHSNELQNAMNRFCWRNVLFCVEEN